tara:strand:+ start:412 stop:1410 length:999 start_codon:yes stop_codon:yes gene_type:complete
MNLNERISLFSSLGKLISNSPNVFEEVVSQAIIINPWFTKDHIRTSFLSISQMLDEKNLNNWILNYDLNHIKSKKVLIIMAGNVPMVGFHDLLCVLISGHSAIIKFSSKDNILMKFIIDKLISISSEIKNRINIVDDFVKCKFDALIATGSDNSSKYFDYYFKDYKSIIRKNRRSVAILNGNESDEDLKMLAKDIFLYFGLGCRNVSKIFLPKNYKTDKLFNAFYEYKEQINHIKYSNNYDYNKTVYLMNGEKLLDNGFVLLKEDTSIQSPVATIFFEYYNNRSKLDKYIMENRSLFQCVVSKENIQFGQTQFPKVNDYSDQIDTIEFLIDI